MNFISKADLPAREVIKGYQARTIHTGNLTLVYWSVEAGAAMPLHSHLHEQVSHVLSGIFELTVGDETRLLDPGIVAAIPPHIPHGGRAVTDCELLDVFYPEREDYRFTSPA